TSKSMIEGILNANGKNVFLINPNGIIITKTGTINANRFVASTSSMDSESMQAFADMKTLGQGLSFSPIFKPHKAGNVVNMGNINANDVLLIGNKVDIQGGKLGNKNSTTHLVGKNVYIDADSTNLNSTINVTATEGGYIQRQMINFANDGYNFGNNVKVHNADYKDSSGTTHTGSSNFKKALTIGNMGNEKDNAIEWWHFAKGWNEGLGVTRSIDEFRLVGNIDFSGNKGKGVEGKDWQNYANYCIDGLGCTSMIVGRTYDSAFAKTFDGQGFTLKNINIDTTILDNKPMYVGLFGSASDGAIFKNINVDYKNGGINASYSYATGGFIGNSASKEVYFENINVDNINEIKISFDYDELVHVGGFAGNAFGNFKNIILNKVGKIDITAGSTALVGGFAGVTSGSLENIVLNEIGKIDITAGSTALVGGFAGGTYGDFKNIVLNEIGKIDITAGSTANAGGFTGQAEGDFKNITINSPIDIRADYKTHGHSDSTNIGGFVGLFVGGKFENISLENITIELIPIDRAYVGGFVGAYFVFGDSYFKNIALKNITTIGYLRNFGGFIGNMGYSSEKNHIFENIYIFSIQNINSELYESGKFLGGHGSYRDDNLKFNNVHIYHHENELNDANHDQNSWGNTSDKIQIHIYNDDNKGKFEEHFTQQANAIPKPMLPIIPPFKPTDPIDPSNPDVILDSDDLYGGIIASIINEIRNEKYTIDIKNLVSLINAFKGLDKDSSENEIKAVIKTHLGIDGDKALSMAQSISFLLNYQEHNFDGRLSEQAKTIYDGTIKPNVSNTLGLISYLDKNKDYLLEQYNKHKELEQVFKDKEQAYKKAEAEFNRLLDLVNKGKLSYNDPKFTQAFDNWLNAYNDYNDLSNDISELNNNVEKIANYITDENKGLAYTKFSFTKFDDIAKIDLVKPELPDIDNSQGGDLPAFEQTASLNLIGDNALDDDDEKKEIDETSLAQKNKTCIVSDNYKTMNPCVAGM
ncbi:filamentous hemagglutinin N-terminal domain-containing protein, partial [Campylobacter lari]|nr:filamentous hemagglutinin N-terminal domain-containing protein [Campylobacter lari]